MKRILPFLLLIAIAFTSCGNNNAPSLSDGVTPRGNIESADVNEAGDVLADFGLRLFAESFTEDKNTLVSPLSVMFALAMTANGAEENTREQMESVLGMDIDSLNAYLKSYKESLPEDEKNKLSVANSIWFTDHERFTVNDDFLQLNADYYGADIYKAPFNNATCRDINNWVKEKTDGMIKDILDEIPTDAVMYLVNALAFDAEWQDIYEKHQVRDAVFTKEDGTARTVDMMYSDEHAYLEGENFTGFIKYYSRSKYAFAAMLPSDGVSVSELITSLDGEMLYDTLSNPISTAVNAGLPKFEFEFDTELSDILSDMGMSDAFDGNLADFSGLGSSSRGNIFINRVLHKTYIEVGEKGTRAGAATVVEMNDCAAADVIGQIKEVILDRPFVFMLIDTETNLPFFIGSVMDIE